VATYRTAAVDPGCRAFATIYCPEDGTVVQWGVEDQKVLRALNERYDHLEAVCALGALDPRTKEPVRHARRYRLRKVQARVEERIQNLVDELHKKLALFLVMSYDKIIIPKFGVVRMTARGGRKINAKTARSMLTWAHARFRARLVDKASRHGKQVIFCDEAYTSRTCTRCGVVKAKPFSSKVFKCRRCGLVCDRDDAGSRNIMLRAQQELGTLGPAPGRLAPHGGSSLVPQSVINTAH